MKVNVTMARLTRFVLMLGSAFGFAAAVPCTTQAGVIPWVYDAIFGPVGSMRGGSSRMYANYGYAGYAPTTVAYAPMSTAYAGSSGCSSCSQSAYYAPTGGYEAYYGYSQPFYGSASNYANSCCNSCNSCGGCNTCSGGNCANGSCSNCTTTTSGYGSTGSLGPVPDPATSGSRSIEHQLNDLRLRLEELDHRQKQDEKYLRDNHEGYKPTPYNSRLYDRSEPVPARGNRREETFGSSPSEQPFPRPRRTGAPASDPLEEESRKPNLSAPGADDKSGEKTNDDKSDSTKSKEDEPVTRRMDTRVTTRAIAPRDRKQIVSTDASVGVAKASKKSDKTPMDSRRITDLVRH